MNNFFLDYGYGYWFLKENLNGWVLDLFLYDLNRIYINHRDEILNILCNQKANNEILEIILSYF